MSADSVFFPARSNFLEAIEEALQANREPTCILATDGKRMAWLPRILPGWFKIDAAVLRVAA